MEKNKPIIVGVGELLWDFLPTGKRAGGAPINLVYHSTQMGAEGYAISAVGKDDLGDEIIEELQKNHIANNLSIVDHPTGKVDVALKEGIPTYTIVEGVAWDYIPLTDESVSLVKRADAVCFGSLALRSEVSRKTILSLLDQANKDAIRFFDINIRQSYYSKELIEQLLQKSNVLKINDEELLLLRDMFHWEGTDQEVCHKILSDYQLKYVILTAGGNFSSIYSLSEESTIPTPKVKVADTVGAGDSFSGAFIYSILTGSSLREAHQKAVDIAAFVCTHEGAWPPYEK